MGHESLSELVAALLSADDDDHFVARNAANALGRMGNPDAVEPLMAALKHPHYGVREKAAEALGKIGDPRARAALTEALKEHPSQPLVNPDHRVSNVRSAVEGALRRIPEQQPDPQTIPGLIALFDAESMSERARAATAVAVIGTPAIEPLLAAYDTHKESVRRSVTQALAEIKDHSTVAVLVRIAERDASLYVRREAAQGLLNRNDAREHHKLAHSILWGV